MAGLLFFLVACALHTPREGLIEPAAHGAALLDADGHHWHLILDQQSAPLAQLEGCVVQVGGRRLGRRLVVSDWQVLDAGDGSAPFLGRLYRDGLQWVIEDHTTGMSLVLDPEHLGGLDAYAGHMVLIVGYVIGAQQVRPVSWRVLD